MRGGPDEVVELVFSKLQLADRIRCCLVCKQWRKVIDSQSERIWQSVDVDVDRFPGLQNPLLRQSTLMSIHHWLHARSNAISCITLSPHRTSIKPGYLRSPSHPSVSSTASTRRKYAAAAAAAIAVVAPLDPVAQPVCSEGSNSTASVSNRMRRVGPRILAPLETARSLLDSAALDAILQASSATELDNITTAIAAAPCSATLSGAPGAAPVVVGPAQHVDAFRALSEPMAESVTLPSAQLLSHVLGCCSPARLTALQCLAPILPYDGVLSELTGSNSAAGTGQRPVSRPGVQSQVGFTNLQRLLLRVRNEAQGHRHTDDLTFLSTLTALTELTITATKRQPFPRGPALLPALRSLSLNNVSGVAQDVVGFASHLTCLSMRLLMLNAFPAQVLALKNLQQLQLTWTPYWPGVNVQYVITPDDITLLHQLTLLRLNFHGRVALNLEALGGLRQLRRLIMLHGRIDTMPLAWSQLQTLHSLELQQQPLDRLPTWLSALTALQRLRICPLLQPQLTLPRQLQALTHLRSITVCYGQRQSRPRVRVSGGIGEVLNGRLVLASDLGQRGMQVEPQWQQAFEEWLDRCQFCVRRTTRDEGPVDLDVFDDVLPGQSSDEDMEFT